jgi:hypothetical protein
LPQYNTEHVVYARRGTPLFIDTRDFRLGFSAPRREHSRKPSLFYDTVRRVTGGSRIDVFSREPHEGFAQYGNELLKFAPAPAAPPPAPPAAEPDPQSSSRPEDATNEPGAGLDHTENENGIAAFLDRRAAP